MPSKGALTPSDRVPCFLCKKVIRRKEDLRHLLEAALIGTFQKFRVLEGLQWYPPQNDAVCLKCRDKVIRIVKAYNELIPPNVSEEPQIRMDTGNDLSNEEGIHIDDGMDVDGVDLGDAKGCGNDDVEMEDDNVQDGGGIEQAGAEVIEIQPNQGGRDDQMGGAAVSAGEGQTPWQNIDSRRLLNHRAMPNCRTQATFQIENIRSTQSAQVMRRSLCDDLDMNPAGTSRMMYAPPEFLASISARIALVESHITEVRDFMGITDMWEQREDLEDAAYLDRRATYLRRQVLHIRSLTVEASQSGSNEIELSSQHHVETTYSRSQSQSGADSQGSRRNATRQDQPSNTMRLTTIPYTQAKCFICSEKDNRGTVSMSAVVEEFIAERIFIHPESRCCKNKDHYTDSGFRKFSEVSKAIISRKKETNDVAVKNKDLLEFLTRIADLAHSRPGIANFTAETDTKLHKLLLGVTKETFELLHGYVQPHLRKSAQRSTRNALAIFLARMRLGLSQTVLGHLFAMDAQSSISYTIRQVKNALMVKFVPDYLGFQAIPRERIQQKTDHLAKGILGLQDDQIGLVADGTYIYIQKSADHHLQKLTWSTHKLRNLVKFMNITTTDGWIVDTEGPFGGNYHCNDGKILDFMLSREGSTMSEYLRESDILVLDRGFRAGERMMGIKKIRHVEPRSVHPSVKKMVAQDASFSRGVTMLRWVVEHDNGWLKNTFKFIDHVLPNTCLNDIGDYYRIACAIHNLVAPPLSTDKSRHSRIVEEYHQRVGLSNLLAGQIIDQRLHLPRASWTEVSKNSPELNNFPKLSEVDILDLTHGPYQLDQAKRYAVTYYRFLVHCHEPNLLRVKIKSRHRSSEYFCWIQHDNTRVGSAQIIGYCCDCMPGDRIFGMCSHLTSALWYLGFRRHDDNPLRPFKLGKSILDLASYVSTQQRTAEEEEEVVPATEQSRESPIIMPTLDLEVGSQLPLPTN